MLSSNTEVNIKNYGNFWYMTNIKISGKDFLVSIDTGSSYLWVPSVSSTNSDDVFLAKDNNHRNLFSWFGFGDSEESADFTELLKCTEEQECHESTEQEDFEYSAGKLKGYISTADVTIGALTISN